MTLFGQQLQKTYHGALHNFSRIRVDVLFHKQVHGKNELLHLSFHPHSFCEWPPSLPFVEGLDGDHNHVCQRVNIQ